MNIDEFIGTNHKYRVAKDILVPFSILRTSPIALTIPPKFPPHIKICDHPKTNKLGYYAFYKDIRCIKSTKFRSNSSNSIRLHKMSKETCI